jgi:hypothetical protein
LQTAPWLAQRPCVRPEWFPEQLAGELRCGHGTGKSADSIVAGYTGTSVQRFFISARACVRRYGKDRIGAYGECGTRRRPALAIAP